MDAEMKIDTKAAIIGIVGIVFCFGIWFLVQAGFPMFQMFEPFLFIGIVFFITYAVTARFLTAIAPPLVFEVGFYVVGRIAALPDGAALKTAMLSVQGYLAPVIVATAIGAAIYVHKLQKKSPVSVE